MGAAHLNQGLVVRQVLVVNEKALVTPTLMAHGGVSGHLDYRHLDYDNRHPRQAFHHHPVGYGDAYLVVEDKDLEDRDLARIRGRASGVVAPNQVHIHGEGEGRADDESGGGRLAAAGHLVLGKSWVPVGRSW